MVTDNKFSKKILVVDDDGDTVMLVGTTLEKQGYTIISAQNGVEALEKAAQEHPDLILLDVMMPEMDGLEILRRLRSEPTTSDIHVIMFTAKSKVDDKVAGLEAGADEYLTKPTHPAELVARVRSVLKRPTAMLPPLSDKTGGEHVVFGVVAAKGGQGVSTLCINLGATLHELHPEAVVAVAELRPGRGDISVFLGQNNAQGLNDLFKTAPDQINRGTIGKALVTHKSGVKYLLASNKPSDAAQTASPDQMGTIVHELNSLANYAVLDLGVGLPEAMLRALGYCDTVILVIEPDPHTMVQTKALLADINTLGAESNVLTAMLSRVRTDQAMTATEVEQALGIKLDVVFTPAPELAYQASRSKQPMVTIEPKSYTAQQTLKMATLLTESEKN
jgi:CheY-like chemotaxis protein/MinD-like ATPase involved in chromosome partitioning or flagellar assembly